MKRLPVQSAVFAFAIVLIVWELAAWRIGNVKLLPPIRHVCGHSLASFARFSGGDSNSLASGFKVILYHTGITFIRVIIATTIGCLLGLLLGLLSSFNSFSRMAANTCLPLLRNVPLLALTPLFVFWFGGNPLGIYVWIAFASFVVMVTATVSSIANINPDLIILATVLGTRILTRTTRVVIPAILPDVVTAYQATMGLAWSFALGGEYLVARSGLGFLVSYSYIYADMGKLLFLVMLYGGLGLLTFEVTGYLGKIVCPWNVSAHNEIRKK
ncbi:MAG: ABC transporter permease subunit [Pirellulaceae bacterium]|nr:ABC transporter permease subunit [Pirellulaceae bacterium]